MATPSRSALFSPAFYAQISLLVLEILEDEGGNEPFFISLLDRLDRRQPQAPPLNGPDPGQLARKLCHLCRYTATCERSGIGPCFQSMPASPALPAEAEEFFSCPAGQV